jgi:o-succinylbenzoate---CoA ligase
MQSKDSLTQPIPTAAQIYQWLELNDLAHLVPAILSRIGSVNEQRPDQTPGYRIIANKNPEEFITEFWAAVLNQVPVFLTDPNWGTLERQQFQELLSNNPKPQAGQILIPTGGTSGQLKFAIHTAKTLAAATRGFQEFYEIEAINSFCLLPLHHVSGLMQLWRSATTCGHLKLATSPSPVPSKQFFLSLVPTQLQRWLPDSGDWLRSFRAVIIGGAPLPADLAIAARHQGIPLSPSYGSTETAAMVTALPPSEFLAGRLSSGLPLPHVHLQIGLEGLISIESSALMDGYWPPSINARSWGDDLGAIDEFGHLQILGRHSQKIISGGEKVFPQEVEAAVRATGLVLDVCAIGWPDVDWGERVVALYVPKGLVEIEDLRAAISGKLSKFKQPKDWLPVEVLPRNDRGKIDRQRLISLVANHLSQPT